MGCPSKRTQRVPERRKGSMAKAWSALVLAPVSILALMAATPRPASRPHSRHPTRNLSPAFPRRSVMLLKSSFLPRHTVRRESLFCQWVRLLLPGGQAHYSLSPGSWGRARAAMGKNQHVVIEGDRWVGEEEGAGAA